MKSYIPILSLAVLFASCTTAYKSGQTPDDVYYSPERPREEYVRVERRDDRQYRDEYEYREDQYLRMRVRNRRWSTLDDDYFFYSYRPYYYHSPFLFNSPWNSHMYWNHFYNPYFNNVVVVNPRTPVYNGPRTSNMNIFNNPGGSNNNPKATRRTSGSSSAGNSGRSGGSLREVFGGGSSSSGSSGATRSSGSSGSSSSGSSGGSKAPVRRF